MTLAESYRVGELIATLADHDRYAGNDGTVWIRELHRGVQSSFSLASLHRHHAVFAMLSRLGLQPRFEHLGRAHLRAIATLPANRQRATIRRADRERWTSRQLEVWIAGERTGRDRGRRRLPAFAKQVRGLRDFAQAPVTTLTKLEGLDAMSSDQVEELMEILRATQQRTTRMLAKLARQSS